MRTKLVCLVLILGSWLPASGQNFQNLNFESGTIVPHDPFFGFLDWNVAAPGWSHSSGNDTSIIYYGMEHLSSTQYYIMFSNVSPTATPGTQLAGNYSLGFASGFLTPTQGDPFVQAYLAQTGAIASGIHSIQFLARGAPFALFVGGVQLPIISLGWNAYGSDISSFAGTTAEIRFVNTTTQVHNPVVLDNVTFSTAVIPEPSIFLLLPLGLLLLFSSKPQAARR